MQWCIDQSLGEGVTCLQPPRCLAVWENGHGEFFYSGVCPVPWRVRRVGVVDAVDDGPCLPMLMTSGSSRGRFNRHRTSRRDALVVQAAKPQVSCWRLAKTCSVMVVMGRASSGSRSESLTPARRSQSASSRGYSRSSVLGTPRGSGRPGCVLSGPPVRRGAGTARRPSLRTGVLNAGCGP